MKTPGTLRTIVDRLLQPGLRLYLYVGVAALLFNLFVLSERNAIAGGLIILLIGIPGLIIRWTFAPLLVILLTFYFAYAPSGVPSVRQLYSPNRPTIQLTDILISISLLVYTIAQYRVNSVVSQAFSLESKPVHRPLSANDPTLDQPIRRPPEQVRESEIGSILGQGIGFSVVSVMGWYILYQIDFGGVYTVDILRFLLMAWLISFGMVIAQVMLGYLRWRSMSRREASMFLRDTLWRETRREQQRLHTWRQWFQKRWKVRSTPESDEQSENAS